MKSRGNEHGLGGVILEALGNDYPLGLSVLPSERARRQRRLRRTVALRLRSIADRLEPEHEIVVHVRPVIVDQDHINQTVQMLTELERRKLGLYQPPSLPGRWTLDGRDQ